MAMDGALVLGTPKDTGRAQGNWLTSIRAPNLTTSENTSSEAAISQGRAVIGQWRVGRGAIFIANSLPYIKRLDEGYSRQAPAGFTKQALAVGQRIIKGTRLLKGR